MATELIAACLAAGLIIQAVATWRDRRRFTAPGVFVDGLHARRTGRGQPAVVFEAGIAASSSNWSVVQRAVAESRETMSYDRRGVGWSRMGRARSSLEAMSNDLHHVVRVLDVTRPFVIVAHSFGSYVACVYASRFRQDVSALVLIDPITPEEWVRPDAAGRQRIGRAIVLAYIGAGAAAIGLVRLGLWGMLRRGNGDAGPLFGLSSTLRRIASHVAKLPEDVVPALRARWSEPRFFTTMASAIRRLPSSAQEALRHPIPTDLPVTVLSSADLSAEKLEAHAALATTHIVAQQCGHWIHLDQPALVVEAVLAAAATSAMDQRSHAS